MLYFKMQVFKYNNYHISYKFRNGKKRNLVFLHGLGDNKNSFKHAFVSKFFDDFNILTVDMIGFGESEKPKDFDYCIKKQSEMLAALISSLNISDIYLIGHSFGGTAAVFLAGMLKDSLNVFINCEGMLTEEDITWSKKIYFQTIGEFKNRGFKNFREKIRTGIEKYPSNEIYYQHLEKTIPEAVYLSVKSMIDFIKNENLIRKFVDLQCPKHYIFGKNSHKRKNATELFLKECNIPVYYITESGHFMLIDNPDEFYKKIKAIISDI